MIGIDLETTCKGCAYSYMQNIFSPEDFNLLDCNRREMLFSPGNIVLKQGSFVSQILFLKKGIVKVVLEDKNDRNTILKFIDSKNFIALPILGNSDIYPYSVVAITECTICVIRKEAMINIIERNKDANRFLLNFFASDYLYLYKRISVLGTRNNHGKLASALHYLSSKNFKDNILENISRKDLAQLATISIESCNKILMELKNDKIIEIKNYTIIIKDHDLIKRLSSAG